MEAHLDTRAKGVWVGGLPSAAQVAMSSKALMYQVFPMSYVPTFKDRFGQLMCHLLVWFPDALIALPPLVNRKVTSTCAKVFFPFVIFSHKERITEK